MIGSGFQYLDLDFENLVRISKVGNGVQEFELG